MDIHVTGQGSVTVLRPTGRVDSMSASRLGDALSLEITNGHTLLVLDLADVNYMSSAGLRELVSAVKKVRRAEGDLRLAQPTHRVREVFEMAGLDTIFLIFESSAEAVESF